MLLSTCCSDQELEGIVSSEPYRESERRELGQMLEELAGLYRQAKSVVSRELSVVSSEY